jgi:hypothetical protein
VVTAEASLHHLPLCEGLTRLAELTRPGGLLIVIGLYLTATRAHRAMELVTLPANAVIGIAKAINGKRGGSGDRARRAHPQARVPAMFTGLARTRSSLAVRTISV